MYSINCYQTGAMTRREEIGKAPTKDVIPSQAIILSMLMILDSQLTVF